MLTREIPKELLDIDYSNYFTKEQAIQLMDDAISPHQGAHKLLLMTAKIRLLAALEEYELACSLAREIRSSADWDDWVLYDVVQAENHIPADLVFPGIEKEELVGVSRNYDLLRDGEFIYAIPHALGQFAIADEERQNNPKVLKGKSLAEVQELIGEIAQPPAEPLPSRLLDSDKGYNLMVIKLIKANRHTQRFALAMTDKLKLAFDRYQRLPGSIRNIMDRPVFKLKNAYEHILALQRPINLGSELSPRLLDAYKGYNLVDYKRRTYGIPISLGHVDLTNEVDRNRPGIIVAETLQEVSDLVDKAVSGGDVQGLTIRSLPSRVLYRYHQGGLRNVAHYTLRFLQERFRN